jgi:cytosine/adenosine deaminase-related metal-dependent hydrolase
MERTGTILVGPSFEPVEGRVVVEDGEIAAIEEESVASDDIILPQFVNAHTHIGDSIAKEAGGGLPIEALVAPPDGLKHQLLRETDRAATVAAMRTSIRLMASMGTAAFIEFREGGVEGVYALQEAADGFDVDPFVLGRGSTEVLGPADGYGASGANDADFASERNATRNAGKFFAIHAGEVDSSDINPAIDLAPDMLVHMVNAEPLHLDRVEDNAIPIAVCPRSNLVTGVGLPPVAELDARTTVALGTDNVMLNSPSMFREMEFAAKCCDLDAATVLHMATRAGASIIGRDDGLVETGRPANLLVLDGNSDTLSGYRDAVRAVVRRAGVADVAEVVTANA